MTNYRRNGFWWEAHSCEIKRKKDRRNTQLLTRLAHLMRILWIVMEIKAITKKKKRWLKGITKVLLLHGKPTGTRKGKGRHHQQLLIQTWLLRNLEKKIADALPRKMDGFLYRIVIKLFELFGGKDFPFQKRFQHLCFGSKHIHPMQRRSLAMFSLETLPLKTQTWAIKRKHCLHFCFFFCK